MVCVRHAAFTPVVLVAIRLGGVELGLVVWRSSLSARFRGELRARF